MRIFYSFLILFVSVILWILPITESTYAFRTDLKLDRHYVSTGVGETTANVTLFDEVYDDDTSTIELSSSDSDDVPLFTSYNTTTREMAMSGLAESTDRTISVLYDVDALVGHDVFHSLMDQSTWIYILMIIVLPLAGIAAVWTGRA